MNKGKEGCERKRSARKGLEDDTKNRCSRTWTFRCLKDLDATSSTITRASFLRSTRKYDVTNEALHAEAPNLWTACSSHHTLRPVLRSTRLLLASRRQKQCSVQGTIHGFERRRAELRFSVSPRCLDFLSKTPPRHLRNAGSTPKDLRSLPHQYRARLARDPS